MLTKEYRICMPLSVEEYRIGQLYMIAKHSQEQSEKGEGVEVVQNEACSDPVHGKGQYTEKRVHLSSRLPSWLRSLIPDIFYITEKAWNYFPYTLTEYTCSFIPKFSIHIETRYENNNGSSENCLQLSEEELKQREVEHVDIAFDELPPKHYKEEEDLTRFKSVKTQRGPLQPGWRETSQPIMCSYKLARVKFEVFGLQGRVESFTHRSVRDILLLGHRQAFAWIDDWYGMTLDDTRDYEDRMNKETNEKVLAGKGRNSRHSSTASRHSSTASAASE
ncbi:cytoplasmic phosphatidylinositol transfer protein 1-like [Littorina saxatilis]|uniref:Cytoplasmic phosphatidylinositol transfer protein 1 n=1 Tax=Littorina saxatilis TaxID=31220 RepID=A0AAN9BVU5_9CAEN